MSVCLYYICLRRDGVIRVDFESGTAERGSLLTLIFRDSSKKYGIFRRDFTSTFKARKAIQSFYDFKQMKEREAKQAFTALRVLDDASQDLSFYLNVIPHLYEGRRQRELQDKYAHLFSIGQIE